MMKKPLSFQKTVFITQKSNISSKLHGVEGGGGGVAEYYVVICKNVKQKLLSFFFLKLT